MTPSLRFSISLMVSLCGACAAPPGPTGPEKAAAYHAQEAEREESRTNPKPKSEAELTLQFEMCEGKKPPPFPPETNGAAFRAIVWMRIAQDGSAVEHCYLAIDGDRKWEEKALGDVEGWSYSPEQSGEPREKVVTYRLK